MNASLALAEEISSLVRECLFVTTPTDPETWIHVDGIVRGFGFDKFKLGSVRPRLSELIRQIVPEPFFDDAGGGMSFLKLAETRDGELWAQHVTLESFVCLSVACGLADYCIPKPFWAGLPGGMPYVVFFRSGRSTRPSSQPAPQDSP